MLKPTLPKRVFQQWRKQDSYLNYCFEIIKGWFLKSLLRTCLLPSVLTKRRESFLSLFFPRLRICARMAKLSVIGGSVVKSTSTNAGDMSLIPGSGKLPWRRKWQPTPVFLPGKSHRQRSLEGCNPWGHKRVRHNLATKQQQI